MLSALQFTTTLGAALAGFLALRTLARRRRGERLLVVDAGPLFFMIAQLWPPRGWLGDRWAHWIPYADAGRTIVPGLFPLTGERWYWIADPQACKAILNDHVGYVKDVQAYEVIQFFGKNIVGTEGEEWVKHRAIARKSFGERNNALMWTETLRVMEEWFSERDAEIVALGGSTLTNVTPALREITLLVFASAAFGLSFSRSTLDDTPAGYTMSFGKSLFVAIDNMFVRAFVPRLFYALPFKVLRETDAAYNELPRHISQLIKEVRARRVDSPADDDVEGAADLFRRLVAANDMEKDSSIRLADDELVSNIYAFFLAGHETSAHTLAFCFGLLALHPEVQDRIWEEVEQVWATDDISVSTLADFNKLEYTMAVIRESLRLFPAELLVDRTATKDASLPSMIRQPDGSWTSEFVDVPRGTACVVNIHALHMSPLYWGDDVKDFRPERFLDADKEWPRDAWIPFTTGPRVCIGQRFALIESVCIVARTISRYRLSPPSDILALPRSKQYQKLLKYTIAVTTTPGDVNLTLTPRHL